MRMAKTKQRLYSIERGCENGDDLWRNSDDLWRNGDDGETATTCGETATTLYSLIYGTKHRFS